MTLLHRLAISAIILSGSINAHAADCTAIANGNWSDPATWSCGAVPGCGDVITIPSGITVTVDIQVNLDESSGCNTPTSVVVYGILQMGNGKKMNFAAGSSVEIMPGGLLLKGSGGGNSNEINITGSTSWIAEDGSKVGYFLIGVPIPLPVEFIEFTVSNEQNVYIFSWTVASERENNFFLIQYSIDGINWIDFIKTQSIGEHNDQYTYTESGNNLEGMNTSTIYFKLSQTDLNGKISVLEVKSIRPSRAEYSIYPNPINQNQKLNVSIYSYSKDKTEVVFYNGLGQLVLSESIYLEEGMNNQEVQLVGLNKGIYLVKIPNGSSEQVVRLIVE